MYNLLIKGLWENLMILNMIVNNFEDIFKKPVEIENLSSLYPKSFYARL